MERSVTHYLLTFAVRWLILHKAESSYARFTHESMERQVRELNW